MFHLVFHFFTEKTTAEKQGKSMGIEMGGCSLENTRKIHRRGVLWMTQTHTAVMVLQLFIFDQTHYILYLKKQI